MLNCSEENTFVNYGTRIINKLGMVLIVMSLIITDYTMLNSLASITRVHNLTVTHI